jgi:hypothetical protein
VVTWLTAGAAIALGVGPAAADGGLSDLELTVPIAVMDRSATGTGSELAGYGYDDQTGLLVGGEARLYANLGSEYWHMGVVAGAAHHAGPALGLVDGHAFATTMTDLGVTARVLFPCMSSDEVKWRLSGLLAVSGVHADAGTGVAGQDNGPDWDARRAASDTLDHVGLGWRLALDLSVHLDHFMIGAGLGVRQYFGIDTVVSRGWMMDVGLRIGGRIDFDDTNGRTDRYDE